MALGMKCPLVLSKEGNTHKEGSWVKKEERKWGPVLEVGGQVPYLGQEEALRDLC